MPIDYAIAEQVAAITLDRPEAADAQSMPAFALRQAKWAVRTRHYRRVESAKMLASLAR